MRLIERIDQAWDLAKSLAKEEKDPVKKLALDTISNQLGCAWLVLHQEERNVLKPEDLKGLPYFADEATA